MASTKIEWCDSVWNPITGCSPVSEACDHCWARRMARRLAGRYGYPECPNHFDVTWHRERMDQPLQWKKPKRIFVVSMGDLFHEDVVYERLESIWRVMECAHWHTFLVLTKRPSRMRDLVGSFEQYSKSAEWPPPNIALGITAENQERLDERWYHLSRTEAAIHFISGEPLLGPLELPRDFLHRYAGTWLIIGGETGPKARLMRPAWARSARNQCQEAGVPFFFKQWGAWEPGETKKEPFGPVELGERCIEHNSRWTRMYRVGKKAAGHLLDGVEWRQLPDAWKVGEKERR